MLVVGGREADAGTVAVRGRVQGDLGTMPLGEFEQMVLSLIRSRAISTARPATA